MFQYTEIVENPAFYLLIAVSILLTLGYTWGKRANARILHGAMDSLLDVLRARDQQFTNIGGQTGFHANIVPGAARYFRRVDATITLLPRQSWLYMPFSWLIQKFDRLFLVFLPNKKGRKVLREGHLIDTRFETMRGNRIVNAERLQSEDLAWADRTFRIYYEDQTMREALLDLKERIGDAPGTFKHGALVPDEDQAYLFQIPNAHTVGPITSAFRDWIDDYVEARLGEKQAARDS